jgi:hypothetical protein
MVNARFEFKDHFVFARKIGRNALSGRRNTLKTPENAVCFRVDTLYTNNPVGVHK